MRLETVEVYSDRTNLNVVKSPGRAFPGIVVQGDDLYRLCLLADRACAGLSPTNKAFASANDLRSSLWARLNHYKAVLEEHGISLPFSEQTLR
jgi:hypothetical protein